jgi:hypothetical protein
MTIVQAKDEELAGTIIKTLALRIRDLEHKLKDEIAKKEAAEQELESVVQELYNKSSIARDTMESINVIVNKMHDDNLTLSGSKKSLYEIIGRFNKKYYDVYKKEVNSCDGN